MCGDLLPEDGQFSEYVIENCSFSNGRCRVRMVQAISIMENVEFLLFFVASTQVIVRAASLELEFVLFE